MRPESPAWSAIGALADPVRRRVYEYVAAAAEPVSREQAASGAEIALHSARFHLERLVAEGLLEVTTRRLTGRSGPGAGRPAKLYRRASRDVAISLPPRGYDLVGQVLAAAVQRSLDGAPLADSLATEAHEAGLRDAAEYDGGGSELDRTADVLAGRGFEPAVGDDGVVLGNCPFDALAREHTTLVCGVNHDYVGGVVEGLGCRETVAELDPAPDRCCVRLRRRPVVP
jgi:predicted ArsR family transcriptional regulator